jgi:hypothetical protein
MTKIKVFDYNSKYDAFTVSPDFRRINGILGLGEWTPVVWITRLLCMDNDYGEHVFDNWTERAKIEEDFGLSSNDTHELMIVVPSRFKDGRDGPCNNDEFRKKFWTDVLNSLELDLETIFSKARDNNEEWRQILEEDKKAGFPSSLGDNHFIPELEKIILKVRQEYCD